MAHEFVTLEEDYSLSRVLAKQENKIRPEELRPGNLVRIRNSVNRGSYWDVTIEKIFKRDRVWYVAYDGGSTPFSNITGIPISSPEGFRWLEKVTANENVSFVIRWSFENEERIRKTRIYFIHHLQNIYVDLTGRLL